jgi:hypothetical protein
MLTDSLKTQLEFKTTNINAKSEVSNKEIYIKCNRLGENDAGD